MWRSHDQTWFGIIKSPEIEGKNKRPSRFKGQTHTALKDLLCLSLLVLIESHKEVEARDTNDPAKLKAFLFPELGPDTWRTCAGHAAALAHTVHKQSVSGRHTIRKHSSPGSWLKLLCPKIASGTGGLVLSILLVNSFGYSNIDWFQQQVLLWRLPVRSSTNRHVWCRRSDLGWPSYIHIPDAWFTKCDVNKSWEVCAPRLININLFCKNAEL